MTELSRRAALHFLATASAAGMTACQSKSPQATSRSDAPRAKEHDIASSAPVSAPSEHESPLVKTAFTLLLGRPWPTPDPFLFCVHHNDRYPNGNGMYGPDASLSGRQIGRDFAWKDGWNMYHGETVPGFPAHPHRGFETVTVVRQGRLDHADSLGAAARYGDGDVQWLTAGSGIQHAEMFPLLHTDRSNPLDLFQIWLNLPARSKMVSPYFSMHWAEQIPVETFLDEEGKKTSVEIRAGRIGDAIAPEPPPDSWAHDAKNEVGIWMVKMEAGATWMLPPTSEGVERFVYFFEGAELHLADELLPELTGAHVVSTREIAVRCGSRAGEFLVLQGRPIGEPVAKSGPFVMNTEAELRQAYADYRATRFGGWPWPEHGPVHGSSHDRFARRPDAPEERPKRG